MSSPSILNTIPPSGAAGIRKDTLESRWNTTGANAGGDASIYIGRTHNDVHLFRGLSEGTNVTLTQNDTDIVIDVTGPVYTGTSLGGDADIYKDLVGSEFQFRGVSAGDDSITITEEANYITINGKLSINASNAIVALTTTHALSPGTNGIAMGEGSKVGQSGVSLGTYAGAGGSNTYGIMIGENAGRTVASTTANVIIGYGAADGTNTATAVIGNNNVIIGTDAAAGARTLTSNFVVGTSALSEGHNTTNAIIMGTDAAKYGTHTGTSAIAIGYQAAYQADTMTHTIAIGHQAMYTATGPGSYNIVMGYQAGYAGDLTGAGNVITGEVAGYSLDSGDYNVMIGTQAGQLMTSGTDNVFIGHQAGATQTSGDYNVFIGSGSGSGLAAATSNRLIIRSNGTTLIDGDFSTGQTNVSGVGMISSRILLSDTLEPANPGDGYGLLYKAVTGLYWKADAGGSAIKISDVGISSLTYEEISATADDTTIYVLDPVIGSSMIDVASDGGVGTLAKCTLADGSVAGQNKSICIRGIVSPGDTAEVKITSYLDATGAAGTKSLTFDTTGTSAHLIWTGSYWMAMDAGPTSVGPPSF